MASQPTKPLFSLRSVLLTAVALGGAIAGLSSCGQGGQASPDPTPSNALPTGSTPPVNSVSAGLDPTGEAPSSSSPASTTPPNPATTASASAAASGGPPAPSGMGSTSGQPPVVPPEQLNRSGEVPTLAVGDATLKLEVCTSNIIRVLFGESTEWFTKTTLSTAPKRCDATTPWGLVEDAGTTTLLTSALKARVDLATGKVTFLDAADQVILQERSRTLTPTTIQGEAVFNVQQQWEPKATEALYGLGQQQLNLMNIKGYPLSLVQYNTDIVVPFLVSSEGYGLLWDNESWTRFGDLTEPTVLSSGGNYQGTFTAEVSGDHLFETWASGDIKLTVDGQRVIDHWRQGWLPGREYAKVPLTAGQTVALNLAFESDLDVEIATLSVTPPPADDATSLWSEVADGVDYTFVYGPDLDDVIAGYRLLTGEAPIMPKWAHGLWQCRERYETAEEVTDVLEGFRSRSIPVDNIVQDWQFWVPGEWGSHEFDTSRFPDAAAWIQQIHDQYHAQLMVSVWPKFNSGTANFDELNAAGYLYAINQTENIMDFTGSPMSYYDAFNPDARAMFWGQVNENLFSLGVDAWWADATEPETVEGPYESPEQHRTLYQTHMHPTALGSGSRMLNAFSLVNSQAFYEGQRKAAPDQRVFILTRSAFTGQQRYAAASWSGDISTTWTAFRKQLPAGLNFVLSGIPYWTTDTGGFAEHPRFPGDGIEWEELNSRWFQYSTFVPLLRVHGQDDRTPPREMWNFSEPTYQAQLKYNRTRYRLMPYIYSLAGEVNRRAGTIMRPLVMDFRTDSGVHEIWDQFMFGPALLVNPVTEYQARTRSVYLPQTVGGWYGFESGEAQAGGQTLEVEAPYDTIPVFVRAGSIVPVGPELQYVDEVPADPITLYVYAGANGQFILYEDDGRSYAYEQGAFTEITFTWDDAARTLRFGARQGDFPAALSTRSFNVVVVSPDSPVGFDVDNEPMGMPVTYEGSALDVVLP